ncbi:uncharacterized protein LOC108682075 [Hyalella azteca]|uniref:Uncharacterized protein LOC108682075 n=1 Tax=Hyalella azteca TaxID=294128 RepID=A0A8B7PMS9_HYAAZ|nr:uncharacterized protein LOC108682075 [Hyalella azteca]
MAELNFKVFLRPHPVQDAPESDRAVLTPDYSQNLVQDTISNRTYELDGVFDPCCAQKTVYEKAVQPLVKAVLQGYNATVLAYGQTGSGKTFTMGTGGGLQSRPQDQGILQRALADFLDAAASGDAIAYEDKATSGGTEPQHRRITDVTPTKIFATNGNNEMEGTAESNNFIERHSSEVLNTDAIEGDGSGSCRHKHDIPELPSQLMTDESGMKINTPKMNATTCVLKQDKARAKFCIKLSFLEVYNEKVYDLLTSNRSQLIIRPDMTGGMQATGCVEKCVKCVESAETLLAAATRRRTVAKTNLNVHSSRSHALVGIKLSRGQQGSSVLWVVDLAGSESVGRQYQCAADAAQGSSKKLFNEGVAINKGLLALGKVLSARASGSGHVPYRDSILTQLLRESLCGDACAAVIACARLAHVSQTRTTLLYAEQMRDVRTRPVQQLSSARKMLKRRYEDPTATPNLASKRLHLRTSDLKATRSGALRNSSLSIRGTPGPLAVAHNTTVSTPGHTPAATRGSLKALDSSFQPRFREDHSIGTAKRSPLIFPSLQQPQFEEEHSLPLEDQAPDAPTSQLRASSPLQNNFLGSPLEGVAKLPRSVLQADMSSFISPLVHQVERRIMDKLEDSFNFSFISRFTRSRAVKDATACTGSEQGSPDLGAAVLEAMFSTPTTSGRQRRHFHDAVEKMVERAVHNSVAKRPRRSTRLSVQDAEPLDTLAVSMDSSENSHNSKTNDGFLVPTCLPPVAKKRAKKLALEFFPHTPHAVTPGMLDKKLELSETYKPASETGCARRRCSSGAASEAGLSDSASVEAGAATPCDDSIHDGRVSSTTAEPSRLKKKTKYEDPVNVSIFDSDESSHSILSDSNENRQTDVSQVSYDMKTMNESVGLKRKRGRPRKKNLESWEENVDHRASMKSMQNSWNRSVLGDVSNTIQSDSFSTDLNETVIDSSMSKTGGKLSATLRHNIMNDSDFFGNESYQQTETCLFENSLMPEPRVKFNVTCTNWTTRNRKKEADEHQQTHLQDETDFSCTMRRAKRVAAAKTLNQTCVDMNSSMWHADISHNAFDDTLNTTRSGLRPRQNIRKPARLTFEPVIAVNKASNLRSKKSSQNKLNATTCLSNSRVNARRGDKLNTTSSNRRKKIQQASLDVTTCTVSPSVVRSHAQHVLAILNSGDEKRIQQLPTIGPKYATIISNHRKFFGDFSSIEDATSIPGLPRTICRRFVIANTLLN